VISALFAHVGGLPIEETLGSFGPALLVGFGMAWAKLRARLRRVRSRATAHVPPRETGATRCGRACLNSNSDDELVANAEHHVFGEIRPAASMVQTSALIEPAYVLEIEADAVIG
jgi:hypothetical protein